MVNIFDEAPEIKPPKYWTFLYEEPNNGWWLKIDNVNDLICYHQNIAGIYQKSFEDFLHKGQEYKDTGNPYVFKDTLTIAIVKFAESRNLTILDAIVQFRLMTASLQIQAIHENGYIVCNKVGGYHCGPIDHSQFVRKKQFIWPDFKESDIRISQFPGGTHWYVHIGEMELHENENLKWFTKEEARAAAMRYIEKEN